MQTSRMGQAAITIFVPAEAKPRIRAALADAGYGTSDQVGVVVLASRCCSLLTRM